MSLKWILLAAAAGAGFYAVSKAQPPVATASASVTGDSVAVADVTMGERFRYSVGSVGTAVVGGSIRRSVLETEQSLKDMSKAIKTAAGADGTRAREVALKIRYMDSVAVENLHQGRPIKAMRQSMEAKSLLNSIRRSLTQGV
jgi:hypothetical protein